MHKMLKTTFSIKSKEELLLKISFLCFVLGLVIQIIVIANSFFWSAQQFGLPKAYPGIFIFATILTLVPILGTIVFAIFLLLFISIFSGVHLLGHPWFYHLLGMLIFNAGMILFMALDHLTE